MDKRPIAFFDSGVGGLTVFEKIKKILPNENYIYFGDLKNNPYGEKSKNELIKISSEIFTFLDKKHVKAVVMACNTTSANVYDELKDKYKFKIYPIIQSCAEIISKLPVKKIGVLATEATINTSVYKKELLKHNPDLEVFEISCPPWVQIVEKGVRFEEKSIICVKQYLDKMLSLEPEKIVLGCTHYPYLLDILEKFAPREMFIDPSEYFAEFIKDDLKAQNMLNNEQSSFEEFLVSANPEEFKKAASGFYPISNLSIAIK
jgi:glutamate racemase